MTPTTVTNALEKLDSSDRELVEKYIQSLREKIQQLGGDDDDDDVEMNDAPTDNDDDFPPLYSPPAEDFDKAAEHKQNAADAKDAQNWEKAVEEYTAAILAAPPSALIYANRAYCLLQLGRAKAAERDCDAALKENPDSAKALRMRGKARKELGQWEGALKDLSQAQTIDFDEGTVEDLKLLTEKHLEMEKKQAEDRIKEEEKLRKRAEEIKTAREEAKKEPSSTSRTMPGFPGGIPGVPGGMNGNMDFQSMLGGLMSDPELVAAMQNPKVMAAFSGLMTGGGMPDPAKMQELMSDPEVGPVMQKLMAKFGGMGGMGGGNTGGDDDDGIPDISEVDDIDDLPDLD